MESTKPSLSTAGCVKPWVQKFTNNPRESFFDQFVGSDDARFVEIREVNTQIIHFRLFHSTLTFHRSMKRTLNTPMSRLGQITPMADQIFPSSSKYDLRICYGSYR
jgi:hypothetical protein